MAEYQVYRVTPDTPDGQASWGNVGSSYSAVSSADSFRDSLMELSMVAPTYFAFHKYTASGALIGFKKSPVDGYYYGTVKED